MAGLTSPHPYLKLYPCWIRITLRHLTGSLAVHSQVRSGLPDLEGTLRKLTLLACAPHAQGYTSKRDYLREPPPPGWLEAQVARQAEARRRRVQQVQKDLQLIHRIKAKGQAALQHHQQVR